MNLNEILAPYLEDWWFHFYVIHRRWNGSADAGDCNCPYPKEYDPADGHGYSGVEVDDALTIEDCAAQLIEKIKAVVPGKRHTGK